MFDFLKRIFSSRPAQPQSPPPAQPAPAPSRSKKPAPASLDLDYLEQLRTVGGITMTTRDHDKIQDLIDWGYLDRDALGRLDLTANGHQAIGQSSAWSPYPDPRTDR
jgi:hypothetical protein